MEYSSVEIELLDRDSQTVKKMLLYPVTKIRMFEITHDKEGKMIGRRFLEFYVNDEGEWTQ